REKNFVGVQQGAPVIFVDDDVVEHVEDRLTKCVSGRYVVASYHVGAGQRSINRRSLFRAAELPRVYGAIGIELAGEFQIEKNASDSAVADSRPRIAIAHGHFSIAAVDRDNKIRRAAGRRGR